LILQFFIVTVHSSGVFYQQSDTLVSLTGTPVKKKGNGKPRCSATWTKKALEEYPLATQELQIFPPHDVSLTDATSYPP
jgi:hypothetical protein